MGWFKKQPGPPAMAPQFTLIPQWMLDCTLLTGGGFSIALPRGIAAPGLAPPIDPPDPVPWEITACLHIQPECFVRIKLIPPIADAPPDQIPRLMLGSIANKRGRKGYAVAKGEANQPHWGSEFAARGAFEHRGTDGAPWIEDLLAISRRDAGVILVATLLPRVALLTHLGTLMYVMNRTLLWDPQQFRRPLPIPIAPSVFAEPTTMLALTPYAQNEMVELLPEMRGEGPQARNAIRQLLEPATNRPVVDWDAGLPPPWIAQLQALGGTFTQPSVRDRFHRHIGQVRNGRDLQGFAILWMAATM